MSAKPDVERIRELPVHPAETWEGTVVRMDRAVRDDDGAMVMPAMCLWVSEATGRAFPGQPGPEEEIGGREMLAALAGFACNRALAGYRPGRVRVRDADAADELRRALAAVGIEVEVAEQLPLADGLAQMLRQQLGQAIDPAGDVADAPAPPAGLLEQPGVTVERVRAFADAAAAFHRAAPWRHFDVADLVRVVRPKVERGLRHFSVMGRGGQEFGLSFFPTMRDFRRLLTATDPVEAMDRVPLWSVTFSDAEMLPPADVAAWRTHGLPTPEAGLYPFPARYDRGDWRRPDAAVLATIEACLRAMAALAPADRAAGQWRSAVTSADGPVAFAFEVLDGAPPQDRAAPARGATDLGRADGGASVAADPGDADRARELVYQAWEVAPVKKAIELARRALALDPDNADACLILGDAAPDPAAALDWYERGVAGGERGLGPKGFKAYAGMFWGFHETRPYMRAMERAAETLAVLGRSDEAIARWRRMLELNPNDNQGVRYALTVELLHRGLDDDAAALLDKYPDDACVVPMYAEVLLVFRAGGDSPEARAALARAVAFNPHVVPYLSGRRPLPAALPEMYSPGEASEAQAFAADLAGPWRQTPGAVQWLAAQEGNLRPPPARTPRNRRPRGRGLR